MFKLRSCPLFCRWGEFKILNFTVTDQYSAVIRVAHWVFWVHGIQILHYFHSLGEVIPTKILSQIIKGMRLASSQANHNHEISTWDRTLYFLSNKMQFSLYLYVRFVQKTTLAWLSKRKLLNQSTATLHYIDITHIVYSISPTNSLTVSNAKCFEVSVETIIWSN